MKSELYVTLQSTFTQDREGRKPLSDKDIHTMAPLKKADGKDDGKAEAGKGEAKASGDEGGAAPAAGGGDGDSEAPAPGGGGGGEDSSGGGDEEGGEGKELRLS